MKSKIIFLILFLRANFEEEYYSVLGLKRNATKKDIKKAFKTLTKKWHPDVNKDPKAESKFS